MASGVIETSSGDLLRAGGSYPDADFDAAEETVRNDVPEPFYRRGFRNPTHEFHRWNGSSWELVPQGVPFGIHSASHKIETISANKVVQVDYYLDEIKSVSGFSGFSGSVGSEYYVFSGNKYYGYSQISFDSAGEVWHKLFFPVSSESNKRIYRNFKDR